MNLEMAATVEMQEIALALHPESVTLVPEKREEITTEGGLDLLGAPGSLGDNIETLKSGGDQGLRLRRPPTWSRSNKPALMRFSAIEIHTGQYANTRGAAQTDEFRKIRDACQAAQHLGLAVHAGHGLNYHNTSRLLEIKEIEELNIGHAIVSRALFVGLDRAVRDMLRVMGRL